MHIHPSMRTISAHVKGTVHPKSKILHSSLTFWKFALTSLQICTSLMSGPNCSLLYVFVFSPYLNI